MKKLLIFLLSFIPASAFGDTKMIEGIYREAINLTSKQMEITARYWAETDLCEVPEDGLDGLRWPYGALKPYIEPIEPYRAL